MQLITDNNKYKIDKNMEKHRKKRGKLSKITKIKQIAKKKKTTKLRL